MIRSLYSGEVGLMVPGGQKFFEEGKLPGKFNAEHFTRAWVDYITAGNGEVYGLFDDTTGEIQGALGAVFYQDPLTGDDVCTELFWFVLPEHRGAGLQLLDEYLKRACQRDCKRAYMIHLEALHPEALKRVYEHKGFLKVETGYMKNLCP